MSKKFIYLLEASTMVRLPVISSQRDFVTVVSSQGDYVTDGNLTTVKAEYAYLTN